MRLNEEQIQRQLTRLHDWQWDKDRSLIWREFHFSDFDQTMHFVNAVAHIARQEDHHPVMQVSYNHCLINYSTHSLGGVSTKDFRCAQRIDELKQGSRQNHV